MVSYFEVYLDIEKQQVRMNGLKIGSRYTGSKIRD